MVRANMHANVFIICQRSEHMWQENVCSLPFEILKPDIQHTNNSFRHITTHVHCIHIHIKTRLCK